MALTIADTSRSLADIRLYRTARDVLVRDALADLDVLLSAVDARDPYALKRVLERFLPELTADYGQALGTLSADRYDILREISEAPWRFRASVADPAAEEQILSRIRWALEPAFMGDPAQALRHVRGIVDLTVKQAGRDTIARSTDLDPRGPLYARVPTLSEPCAFCLILAGLGPVYGSASSAQFKESGGKYHDWCGCEPTPVWNRDISTLPGDYNPGAIEERYYKSALDGAEDPSDLKSILSEVRTMNPGMK